METDQIIRRITEAEKQFAALESHRQTEPGNSSLVDELMRAAADTLRDLRALVEPPVAAPGELDVAGKRTHIQAAFNLAMEWLRENPETLRFSADDLQARAAQAGLQSNHCSFGGMLALPLKGADGAVTGLVMAADKTAGTFSLEDQSLLDQAAVMVSFAIQHQEDNHRAEKQANDLQSVFDAMSDVVVLRDKNGAEFEYSRAITNLVGEQVIPTDAPAMSALLQSRHEDDSPIALEDYPYYSAIRGEHVVNQVIAMNDYTGARHLMSVNAAPLYTDGEISGAVSVWHDITERDRAQRQLLAERERQMSVLTNLMQLSQRLLAQTTIEGVLDTIIRGGYLVSGGRVSVAGYMVPENDMRGLTIFPDGSTTSYHFPKDQGSALYAPFLEMVRAHKTVVKLNAVDLLALLTRLKMPLPRNTACGSLAIPLTGSDGQVTGLLVVVDKGQGDFNAEDEASLSHLMLIGSLALMQQEEKLRALRQAEEIEALFNALDEGVLVSDKGGNIRMSNLAAVSLLGPVTSVDREEINRRMQIRHEDERPYDVAEQPFSQALLGRRVKDQVAVVTDPQGNRRILQVSAIPLFTDGKVSGVITVFRDISEREQVQRQLDAERERLETIIENAPEGITLIDENERLVLANPIARRIFGREVKAGDEVVPLSGHRYFYPNGREYSHDDLPAIRALRRGEAVRNVDLRVGWEDGHEHMLHLHAVPLGIGHPSRPGALVMMQDVTKAHQTSLALRRRVHDLRRLNQLSRDIAGTTKREDTIESVLSAVHHLVAATGSGIWLLDDENPGYIYCAGCRSDAWQKSMLNTRLPTQGVFWTDLLEHDTRVMVNSLDLVPALAPMLYEWLGLHKGSLLAIPLKVRDRIIGIISVVSAEEGRYKAYDKMLLETLAPAAAAALDNTSLLKQVQKTAALEERSRLARDLHDAVSQTLFSASLIAESLPRLAKHTPDQIMPGLAQLQRLTHSALAEMRTLLLELRPASLIETSLSVLAAQLGAAAAGRSQLEVKLELDPNCTAPPDIHLGLYRICQEALNNVTKHARASAVKVSLKPWGKGIELRVMDNGRGFNPNTIAPGHFGLAITQERAQSLGLEIEVITAVGQGTEIIARWAGVS